MISYIVVNTGAGTDSHLADLWWLKLFGGLDPVLIPKNEYILSFCIDCFYVKIVS